MINRFLPPAFRRLAAVGRPTDRRNQSRSRPRQFYGRRHRQLQGALRGSLAPRAPGRNALATSPPGAGRNGPEVGSSLGRRHRLRALGDPGWRHLSHVLPGPDPKTRKRAVARLTSKDFLNWTQPVPMTFGDAGVIPPDQHYNNQTHPYFWATHIYLSLSARFMEGRQV